MAYKFTAKQEKQEALIIKDIEKNLKDVLPVLAEMNCAVSIRRQAGEYRLFFEAGFESVFVVVDHKGHYRTQVLEGADCSLQKSA